MLEYGKYARRIERGACHDLADRHAIVEEFRHTVGKVAHSVGGTHRVPVCRDGVWPELLFHDGLDDVPANVPNPTITNVEPDPPTPSLLDLRQNQTLFVNDAMRRWGKHVSNDVTTLHHWEKLLERQRCLPHVSHNLHIERVGHFLRPAKDLKVIGAGDIRR